MRIAVICAALALSAGCARPSRISTQLDIRRQSPDTLMVTLRMTNLENRATTPLAPEVTLETRTDGKWDKPQTIIHPAAFVLNKKEEQHLIKIVKTNADFARATLTVKEAETGAVIKNERFEKSLPK